MKIADEEGVGRVTRRVTVALRAGLGPILLVSGRLVVGKVNVEGAIVKHGTVLCLVRFSSIGRVNVLNIAESGALLAASYVSM